MSPRAIAAFRLRPYGRKADPAYIFLVRCLPLGAYKLCVVSFDDRKRIDTTKFIMSSQESYPATTATASNATTAASNNGPLTFYITPHGPPTWTPLSPSAGLGDNAVMGHPWGIASDTTTVKAVNDVSQHSSARPAAPTTPVRAAPRISDETRERIQRRLRLEQELFPNGGYVCNNWQNGCITEVIQFSITCENCSRSQ